MHDDIKNRSVPPNSQYHGLYARLLVKKRGLIMVIVDEMSPPIPFALDTENACPLYARRFSFQNRKFCSAIMNFSGENRLG